MSNEDRSKCIAKDIIVDKKLQMIHLHRLVRYDTYCSHEENLVNCEEENS